MLRRAMPQNWQPVGHYDCRRECHDQHLRLSRGRPAGHVDSVLPRRLAARPPRVLAVFMIIATTRRPLAWMKGKPVPMMGPVRRGRRDATARVGRGLFDAAGGDIGQPGHHQEGDDSPAAARLSNGGNHPWGAVPRLARKGPAMQ